MKMVLRLIRRDSRGAALMETALVTPLLVAPQVVEPRRTFICAYDLTIEEQSAARET